MFQSCNIVYWRSAILQLQAPGPAVLEISQNNQAVKTLKTVFLMLVHTYANIVKISNVQLWTIEGLCDILSQQLVKLLWISYFYF